MAKRLGFEAKIAKGKGLPRAGDGSDAGTLPKQATRSYETHPSKGKNVGRGTEPIIGKLGK